MKIFRKGGLGALMDEYDRAVSELTRVVNGLTEAQFVLVRDRETQDENCRSIQTIVSHVVSSGFGYANSIREAFSRARDHYTFAILSRDTCLDQLARMVAYTADTLDGRWEYTDEEIMAVQIHPQWGPDCDLEQMLEHAIVHVLRHRRQIERFLAQGASV